MTASLSRTRPLLAVLAGLLAFAAGAALALGILPEWRAGDPAEGKGAFQDRFRRLAGRSGLLLAPGEPRATLEASDLPQVYRVLGEEAPAWLAATRTGLVVEVSHGAAWPGTARESRLRTEFSLAGEPRGFVWQSLEDPFSARVDRERLHNLSQTFAGLLVEPGETAGAQVSTSPFWRMIDLPGSAPGEHLGLWISPPSTLLAERQPLRLAARPERPDEEIRQALSTLIVSLPVLLAAAGVFFALLLKSRIGAGNGAVLALAALASAHPAWAAEIPESLFLAVIHLLTEAPGVALWVFLVWSAGESLLRVADPGFTTSLDTLRTGRLGPRVGRALSLGLAFGGALAGLRLAVPAAAVVLPGISPAGACLPLPVFSTDGSPLSTGISLAAGVALALAVAVRFLPARWTLPGAALLGGWALAPLAIEPFPVELAANVAVTGLLAWIGYRFGLTALLTASVASLLLPALLFSGLHWDWMPVSFALCAALTVGIAGLGLAGLSRPEEAETGPVEPPAFIRRLAEERRVRHEVDLLARMQIGLLPREMPRVDGYDVAARSVLASEAGGDLYDFLRDDSGALWIAAGDVAGHGYSCAIAQAMVKAGLVSLIAPGESPSVVLRQLDRVLRGASEDHSFTSLSLVRLDPATGEAVLGNAGHPYPLLFAAGRVSEIELPGLPLGRGPARDYDDRAFTLPLGGVLVFCSDGLFEALDKNGNAYGFERAREVLGVIGHRPAVEIVDALQNDCRRHQSGEELPDDVTVVAVKRL
ncbi:MAG TPA: PP2C family protein-serine/threonine phosphatase [Thermoanaerobaculia bacterium]|nr:PP2C family protein-serine/threonine phosphatase [Thermoanaerobaculia bacterium]